MNFDIIVGNPPYSGNLHLKIINTVINNLTEEGVASFIHPARWLQDPLAEYKKGSDKVKFKDIVDRLDDVKFIDSKNINNRFGISYNGDLMISTLSCKPTGKVINLYDGIPQEAINVILSYTKKHNVEQVIEFNKKDGWRCQVREMLPTATNKGDSISVKTFCVEFVKLKGEAVFFDGKTKNGIDWTQNQKKSRGWKEEGSPFPLSIRFDNEEEANNFRDSCRTKFFMNIIYLLKFDQHTPLKFLPWMEDYSHPWTDEDYCKFFGNLGMSKECQEWMCRDVYDYRIKDFINYIKFDESENEE